MIKFLQFGRYDEFECIGSECPNTCCAGWAVLIDDETASYYKSQTGEFADKVKKSLLEKDGKIYFKMDDKLRCPLLDERNLCEVYSHMGPQHMCGTCKLYPRIGFYFGDIYFSTLTASCPEVARIILTNQDVIEYEFKDEMQIDTNCDDMDWNKFNEVIKAFSIGSSIIQNRGHKIQDRLKVLLLYANMLDEAIKGSAADTPEQINDFFSNSDNINSAVASVHAATSRNLDVKLDFMREMFNNKVYFYSNGINYIDKYVEFMSNDEGQNIINARFDALLDEQFENAFEQFVSYSLFRYFADQAYKQGVYAGIIKVILLYCAQRQVVVAGSIMSGEVSMEVMIEATYKLSRSVEHSGNDTGLGFLARCMERDNKTTLDYMFKLLS